MLQALNDLRSDIHNRLLNLRSLERTVSSYEFESAYSSACETCQQHARELIAQSNGDGLSRWIAEQLRDDYTSQTIRELRKQGQRLGVPHYSVLSKASLLSEITRYEKEKAARIEREGQTGPRAEFHSCKVA